MGLKTAKFTAKSLKHHHKQRFLIIGSQVRALVRPPSSLRKPRVSDTTPNRALLRGFPATYFSDFGLCRRSRFFVTIFGALSLHPKIPFPAAGALSAKLDRTAHRNSDFWATVIEILD